MALPVVPIAIAIARGATKVLTQPAPWIFFGAWLASSKLDIGVLGDEVRKTIWSLWWVVLLIVIGLVAKEALKVYVSQRGKTERYNIKHQAGKNE